MWAGLFAFFTNAGKVLAALPALIKAFKAVTEFLEVQLGPNWPERLADLQEAAVKWDGAKTVKEQADAASAMAKAFNSRK